MLSDNSIEGNSSLNYKNTKQWVDQTFDNSYENIGKKDSYTLLGKEWAYVGSVHFKYYKAFSTEGGVGCPMVIKPPLSYSDTKNKVYNKFVSIKDLAPTFLEITNVGFPANNTYNHKKNHPIEGVSLLNIMNSYNAVRIMNLQLMYGNYMVE
ncbi:hypothetical protein [Aquimarina sp. I32.4]|uniref:hypothetical protein n=1 Tax=Aquimarina sp. I32.4 TaxID=2053903 RepID=UPI000CDE9571|nr:hypothetical protein [Aquimarina sp. I32.4]